MTLSEPAAASPAASVITSPATMVMAIAAVVFSAAGGKPQGHQHGGSHQQADQADVFLDRAELLVAERRIAGDAKPQAVARVDAELCGMVMDRRNGARWRAGGR